MNEDRIKRLDSVDFGSSGEIWWNDEIKSLIKYVRQLEKDNAELAGSNDRLLEIVSKLKKANAELLAVLKQYNETIENYVTMESQIPFDDPTYKDDVEIIKKVRLITKHKGE